MPRSRIAFSFVLLIGVVSVSDRWSLRADPTPDPVPIPGQEDCTTRCHMRIYFTDGSLGDCWEYNPADCNWCANAGKCKDVTGPVLPNCKTVKGADGKNLRTTRTFYALGSCSPLCAPEKGKYGEATKVNGTPENPTLIDQYQCTAQ